MKGSWPTTCQPFDKTVHVNLSDWQKTSSTNHLKWMHVTHTYSGVAAFFAEVLVFADQFSILSYFNVQPLLTTMFEACLLLYVPHSTKNVFFGLSETKQNRYMQDLWKNSNNWKLLVCILTVWYTNGLSWTRNVSALQRYIICHMFKLKIK